MGSEANPWAALTAEFAGYVDDVYQQPPAERGDKIGTILSRLAGSAVRQAASTLLPVDVVIAEMTDTELAEKMQEHVVFRGGTKLPNSAWGMMLEAAKRLRVDHSKTSLPEKQS